ncbi:hypothetical protein INS49_001623 [Diaporthe citri]|uniref:uncharacterized protein n=1 Tax=Diaporthe citri TaxID=83186 RepID=UPI001C7E9952|nr:uncharacterized protein INS49_001623 [Diaporthe citri]KAG6367434.1 hypothetical protein INS49_001623 [Diaporthe citri]
MSLINLFSHHAPGSTGDVCGSGLGLLGASLCPRLNSLDSQLWSEPKDWSPWTHRPYCQGAWCVHTQALVPSGQGISIITHHSEEQEATEILATLSHDFDEPGCAIGVGGRGPNSDDDKIRDKDRLYEVKESKGKGMGVFATRKIPRGTIIMIDRPIMLKLEQNINVDVLSETQRSHLFDQAATQLSDPDQLLSLAQHDGFTGSQAENAANYNSFQIDLGNGTYSAVFPRVSLPSQVVAEDSIADNLDDIPMGPDWRWFHRQNELRDNWNFECTCSLCSAGSRKREASDERRRKFSDLAEEYHQLNHYDTKASLKALQVLEKAMRINRKEPMLTSATPLIQAAWTAYRGGHAGMAKRYVEEVEEDMRARGFDDEWEQNSLKDVKKLLY